MDRHLFPSLASELSSGREVFSDRDELKPTTHTLGLTKNYVLSWSQQDAFRELYQNWCRYPLSLVISWTLLTVFLIQEGRNNFYIQTQPTFLQDRGERIDKWNSNPSPSSSRFQPSTAQTFAWIYSVQTTGRQHGNDKFPSKTGTS